MPVRNIYIMVVAVLISLLCLSRTSLRQRVFMYVMDKIERESLDDITSQTLYEGALSGMTEQVSDHPYTSYLPLEEKSAYELELQGQVAGIGIYHLTKETGTGEFSFFPIPGTPAGKGGLRIGDMIVEIDGKSVKEYSVWDMIERLRGEEGTEVTLKIRNRESRDVWKKVMKEGDDKQKEKPVEPLRDVQITRAVFQQDIVYGDRRNEDGSWNFQLQSHPEIGYVAISQFTDSTVAGLSAALKTLEDNKVSKLIIDFRGNPGGFLPGAVEICDRFIEAGQDIVTTKYRNGEIKRKFVATDRRKDTFEIAVLIDENSASAAEIVSACLQDHHRAVVVGTRSYGKGTIQELFPLPCQMGMLRLTDASFWRPSNAPLHRFKDSKPEDVWGVQPNKGFEVPVSLVQKGIMTLARDLRRSIPAKEVDLAFKIQLDEINARLSQFQNDRSKEHLEDLENQLGYNLNEFKDHWDDGSESVNTTEVDSNPAPNDSSKKEVKKADNPSSLPEKIHPEGKAPWYDPQLDKAVEYLLSKDKGEEK